MRGRLAGSHGRRRSGSQEGALSTRGGGGDIMASKGRQGRRSGGWRGGGRGGARGLAAAGTADGVGYHTQRMQTMMSRDQGEMSLAEAGVG